MKISKVLSALASTAALIAASFTVMPGGAANAAASPNFYNMNIANQSSEGSASDFVTANGVTYFTVNTVNKGRSIWSLAATAGATPEFVADVAQGELFGSPHSLSVIGNYLYFWDDNTRAYDGVVPWVVNLTTKVVTELQDENGGSLRSDYWPAGNFVGLGGKVYFYANNDRDGVPRLRAWTPAAAGTTELVSQMGFIPSGKLSAFGDKIWLRSENSNWNSADSEIKIFDPATTTWTSVVDGNATTLQDVGLYGVYRYNGADVILISDRSGASYTSFRVDAAGVATRLGTWSTPYGVNFFINMGEKLMARADAPWGSDYSLNEVSTTDGELISQNATMFPAATSVRVSSASYAGGKLYFAGNLNRTGKEQLYMWDGTNAAAQIGTYEPLGNKLYFAEYIASGGWSRNESSGVVGNSSIMNLILDDSIGYEPYLLNPDGTVTLVKNFNTGSEGSSPNTDCSVTTATADYFAAELPIQATNWGKEVIVETKSDGTNLKYSVIDPGTNLYNLCGFTTSGTDLYFSGETDSDGNGLYKMTADHVVTRVGSLANATQAASLVNNKYYYWSDDYSDLYVHDIAGDTDTQLTGTGTSIVRDDSINEMSFSGNYVAFVSEDQDQGNDRVFIVDLAAPTYSEKMVVSDVNATNWNVDTLAIAGGYVFFDDNVDNTKDRLYKIALNSASQNATLVSALGTDQGYIDYIKAAGSDVYLNFYNNSASTYELHKFTGGVTESTIAMPAGVSPVCFAPAGNSVLIGDDNARGLYTLSGTTVTSLNMVKNDIWSVCDAVSSPRGLFLASEEYGFYGGPFDDELIYYGTLTPIATERLGVAVNEGPAGPAGSLPTVDPVAPGAVTGLTATVANGAINLSWTAPTTGTTPRYLVTSTPVGAVCSITGTTASCTGTAGTSYTFTVKAGNEAGLSAGASSAAVVAPGSGVTPPKVNPEDPSVSSVTESKVVKASSGAVTFPDGSGFDIDSKGRIYAKIKSTYLTSTSGTIVVNYKVGSVNKVYTCKVKAFGSLKKLAKAPTKGIVSKSKQACQLPAAAITVLKTKSVVIKATMSVKRYWATTMKAKTPAGKVLKVQARKMTVTMGKGAK